MKESLRSRNTSIQLQQDHHPSIITPSLHHSISILPSSIIFHHNHCHHHHHPSFIPPCLHHHHSCIHPSIYQFFSLVFDHSFLPFVLLLFFYISTGGAEKETKTPRPLCDSGPMVAADACCLIVTPKAPAVGWMWLLLLLQLLVSKTQQPRSSSAATSLQYF